MDAEEDVMTAHSHSTSLIARRPAMKPRAAMSWSGGKDSYLALHRSRSSYDVVAMITMFDEDGTRSRSHGLRPEIVEAQALRLGLTLCPGLGSWVTYEAGLSASPRRRAGARASAHVIFGDIMYESNREFPDRVCAAEGLTAGRTSLGRADRRAVSRVRRTPAPTRASSPFATACSNRRGLGGG